MNRVFAMFFSMAMVAMPLCAASVDFGLWVVSPEFQGDNRTDASDVEISFDEKIGFAGTASILWTSGLSTELGIYSLRTDGSLGIGGVLDESIDLGRLDVMPVTLTMRAHFGGEKVDFYVGGGGAWVRFGEFESSDLRLGGVESIDVDDDATWLANAGLSVHMTKRLRLGFDVKYLPVTSRGVETINRERVDLEFDPLLVSGGVIFRY